MELIKSILSFVSVFSLFGLYVIRAENRIKTLELEKKLTQDIMDNREKIAKLESDNALKIAEIILKSAYTETKLEEIKNQVSGIYEKIVGKPKVRRKT